MNQRPREPLTGDERVLSEREVAQMLGVSLDSLGKWRRSGGGPPYSRVLKVKAVYLRTRVIEWLDSRTVDREKGGADIEER